MEVFLYHTLVEVERLRVFLYLLVPLRSCELVTRLNHQPKEILKSHNADPLHQSQRHKVDLHVNIDRDGSLASPLVDGYVLYHQIFVFYLHEVFVDLWLEVQFFADVRFVVDGAAVQED